MKKKPAIAFGRQLFAEFDFAFDDGDNGLYDFSGFQKQLARRRYFDFPFGYGRNGDRPARDEICLGEIHPVCQHGPHSIL